MLNNFDLPMIIKHGEKGNPSRRVYLQRKSLKRKSRASITTKIRFKSRYVKSESRVVKKISTLDIQNCGLDLQSEVPKIS